MPTKQELDALMTKAKGLQKSLVKSVKSGDIEGEVIDKGMRVQNKKESTPQETVGEKYDPEASATRINNFSSALNTAIDHARQQRKDKTMDFMHGVVPPGALPATSFAGVLSAFNTDSSPLESTLINSASNHAIAQEENKAKIEADALQSKKDTQNSIRELALAVGKAGGKQEVIDGLAALVESGDIDAAIKVAAASLSATDKEIRQLGNNLVRITEDGQVEVIYSAPESSGGGGNPNVIKWTPAETKALKGAGLSDAEENVQLRFLGYSSAIPDNIAIEVRQLPAAIQDIFMNDFDEIQSFTQQATPTETKQFWTNWKAVYDSTTGKGKTKKEEDKTVDEKLDEAYGG